MIVLHPVKINSYLKFSITSETNREYISIDSKSFSLVQYMRIHAKMTREDFTKYIVNGNIKSGNTSIHNIKRTHEQCIYIYIYIYIPY